jgi:hypothetical protein
LVDQARHFRRDQELLWIGTSIAELILDRFFLRIAISIRCRVKCELPFTPPVWTDLGMARGWAITLGLSVGGFLFARLLIEEGRARERAKKPPT